MRIPGPVAQDKDWAREARRKTLLPTVGRRERVTLDFSTVTMATQSFIHALLAEVVHSHGQEGLDCIELQGCSSQVKEVIKTVATYSHRARLLAQAALPNHPHIRSVDVPQADDLQKVCRVVRSLTDGPQLVDAIGEETNYSMRQVYYRINAARTLGLLRTISGIALLTSAGERLVATEPESRSEASILRVQLLESDIVKRIAPSLFGPRGPSIETLAPRIEKVAKLAHTTARRRAKTILAWRRQLWQLQLDLDD